MKRFGLTLLLFLLLPLLLEAAGVPYGHFPWSRAAVTAPGIRVAAFAWKDPRLMKIVVAQIDLHTPGLRLMVTKRARNWGCEMPDRPGMPIRTRRQKTRDFLLDMRKRDVDMRLAVNGSPWTPWEKPWNHQYAQGLGLVVQDWQLVSEANGRPALVVHGDFTVALEEAPAGKDVSGIRCAIAGFEFVLRNGDQLSGDDKALAPRTGYGLSQDGRFLYLFVVDGRQEDYSMGCTVREVGEWLRFLGAYSALNMDGGGSSTLVTWKQGKKSQKSKKGQKDGLGGEVVKWNHQPKDAERTVGANLGIYYEKR